MRARYCVTHVSLPSSLLDVLPARVRNDFLEVPVSLFKFFFQFFLGGRPLNKKKASESPMSEWQRFRRATDPPRKSVMWPSNNLCIVPLSVGPR